MNKLPFEQIESKVLIKKELTTNESYGKRPEDRTVKELLDSSVICLNKPDGPSSHQVADYLRTALKVEKAGHGGTLDPGVSGVLPCALNKSTKVLEALLKAGKEYICLMHIHTPMTQSKIHKTSKEFIGKIMQMPPVKSAVKRQYREREIYYLEILEIKNQDVLFKVGCQAGTYIRTICDSWGKALGTKAHMQQLIRTKAGPFKEDEWYSLQDIKDAFQLYEEGNEKELRKILKPIEFGVTHLQKIWIIDSAVDSICHGANLSIPGISKLSDQINKNDLVAIFTLKDELVAMGTAQLNSEEIIKLEKGLTITIKKVFMDPEVYPHFKRENTIELKP